MNNKSTTPRARITSRRPLRPEMKNYSITKKQRLKNLQQARLSGQEDKLMSLDISNGSTELREAIEAMRAWAMRTKARLKWNGVRRYEHSEGQIGGSCHQLSGAWRWRYTTSSGEVV